MQYDIVGRRPIFRFFRAADDIFAIARESTPLLEWRADGADAELLLSDGEPVARLERKGYSWFFGVVGAPAPAIPMGSREEARLVARFFASRRAAAGEPSPKDPAPAR